jgi:3-oxoacyl-[acyl-carrier protein] reductase
MSPTVAKPFDVHSAEIGDTARIVHLVTEEQVNAFAHVSGDTNPLHMDTAFARAAGFRDRVVHGMVTASLVSQLIGMRLPGPGALWAEQSFRWLAPVFVGDRLEVLLEVSGKSPGTNTISVKATATNQNGKTVMDGNGIVRVLVQRKVARDVGVVGRSALITGGGGGAGAAIAQVLGLAGAKITLAYRRHEAGTRQACDEVIAAGGEAIAVEGNDIRTAVEQALRSFGKPVDLLINSAEVPFDPKPFLEIDWSEVQSQIDAHLRDALLSCQAVIPGMVESGSGRIVNIGSTFASGTPPAQWTGFAIAKAALKTLTRCLAAEFGPKGIRINMVSPGAMESAAEIPERLRKLQAMQTPLRRLTTAEDIAGAVLFLCSEHGEFITGADLPVCGGSAM